MLHRARTVDQRFESCGAVCSSGCDKRVRSCRRAPTSATIPVASREQSSRDEPRSHRVSTGEFMSQSSKRLVVTRRKALLLSATAGLSIASCESALASDSIKTSAHQEPGNCSTPRSAVARTQYGKVRGFVDGGVLTFKGVPYGLTTEGANRWLPAKPPTPWTDDYPALVYGANCPQNLHTWTSPEQTFIQ